MKNILKEEHKAIGGLYFLTTNYLMALILTLSLQYSWLSQSVAIADNLAYIAAVNTNITYYLNNSSYQDSHNPSITVQSDRSIYNPLNDFNNMIQSCGIAKDINGNTSFSSDCHVIYNPATRSTRIQFAPFDTILGITVTPHEQQAIIEDY